MRKLFLSLMLLLPALSARDYGPALNSKMPDFTLPDQNGQARSLKSLLGPKGGFLVFFRSADW